MPPQTGANRLHLELVIPAGAAGEEEVDRLASLGATRAGTRDGAVLMLDPDGNEFSLRRPR